MILRYIDLNLKFTEFSCHFMLQFPPSCNGYDPFFKKVMALAFLPADEIPLMFEQLEHHGSDQHWHQDILKYVKYTSSIWPPSVWSIYMQAVRTNIMDVEDWYLVLYWRAQGYWSAQGSGYWSAERVPFNRLVNFLYSEAKLIVSFQMRFVTDKKLKRMQRKKYRHLFSLWEEYSNGDRNAWQLLNACSRLSIIDGQ